MEVGWHPERTNSANTKSCVFAPTPTRKLVFFFFHSKKIMNFACLLADPSFYNMLEAAVKESAFEATDGCSPDKKTTTRTMVAQGNGYVTMFHVLRALHAWLLNPVNSPICSFSRAEHMTAAGDLTNVLRADLPTQWNVVVGKHDDVVIFQSKKTGQFFVIGEDSDLTKWSKTATTPSTLQPTLPIKH
jgi:hypothetical protein